MKRVKNSLDYIHNLIGKQYVTTEGYIVTIVGGLNANKINIEFENSHIITVTLDNLKKGNVKNVMHKSVLGIGYVGIGNYKVKQDKKHTIYYIKWRGMIERCYDSKYQEKKKTYIGCSVCEEWHNFQNFAKWFEENYNPETMQDWHLDKDILVKGNKIYSPETCCFVPAEINSLFTKADKTRGEYPIGVTKKGSNFLINFKKHNKRWDLSLYSSPIEAFQAYKTEKEKYIKEVADKWKDKIDPRVYQAMYNYKVEITD